MKRLFLALLMIGCSSPPAAHHDTEPAPMLMPPSPVVEDCTKGCDTIPLASANLDVSYLAASDTALTFDLSDNLCARLTTSEGSASMLKTVDSGYELTGCQVFDNRNVNGSHMMPTATAPGVDAWLRVVTGKAEYPGYCELSCAR